eukprot:346030-Rhodomonas_salina.2
MPSTSTQQLDHAVTGCDREPIILGRGAASCFRVHWHAAGLWWWSWSYCTSHISRRHTSSAEAHTQSLQSSGIVMLLGRPPGQHCCGNSFAASQCKCGHGIVHRGIWSSLST